DAVAVHSTHPTAPLSLLARCEPFDADAYRALRAVRLPAMRGAIHLLPQETAHLAFRATQRGPGDEQDYSGLTEQEYEELREALLAAAAQPMTARELRAATGARTTLAPVLHTLTREGVLLRLGAHGLRSNELFYVAGRVDEAAADAALGWLADEYLRAFGPARVEDFQWWAGVTAARARAALATVETEAVDDGLLLRRADAAAFDRAAPVTGTVDLLPRWDCYTMAYPAGARGRFADPDIAEALYDPGGDARPVVLIDGSAAGTWGARPGGALEFELELYGDPGPAARAALEERAAAIRGLLT
ncbi:MAG: hypothetical protein AVDCRST_MAG69-2848, partial [uncultured Solirubrobacteraceae bacterium]